jgi:hypothetical protein
MTARIFFALFLCLAVTSLAIQAQSGRRAPKKAEPVPEATPEPTPTPEQKSKSEDKPKISITLGINGTSGFANIPTYFYDIVLSSCADKLHEASSIGLNVSGRDMNRADAVKLAKSQKETFVAFLELRSDSTAASSSNQYDNVYVEYSLFAPETAKVVASGRAYQRQSTLRGVIPGLPGRASSVYTEQMLKQAGHEAGDRILSALHVSAPRPLSASS